MHIAIKFPDFDNYLTNSSPLGGATYYLDVATGNDQGAGSLADPWRTFPRAVGALQPGDSLYVQTMDFIPEQRITIYNVRGTESAPIKIIGINRPRLRGITLLNCKNVLVSGFNIIGLRELPSGWEDMPAVVVDDPSIKIDPSTSYIRKRRRQIEKKYKTYSVIKRWESNDSAEGDYLGGVEFDGCTRCTVNNCKITLSTYGAKFLSESSYCALQYCTIENTLVGVQFWGGNPPYEYSAEHCLVFANTITQSYREGILLSDSARSNYIYRNTITFSGTSHVATWGAGENNKIMNNTLEDGGFYSEAMRSPGSSGISAHSSGITLVHGNMVRRHIDVTGRDGNGIIADFAEKAVAIVNNIVEGCMGSGVTSTESENVIIAYNTIVNVGLGNERLFNGVGIRAAQDENKLTIVNNIMVNCAGGGVLIRYSDFCRHVTYHNVIFVGSGDPNYIYFAENKNGELLAYSAGEPFPECVYGTISADPGFVQYGANYSLIVPLMGHSYVTTDVDFNGSVRETPTIGAFI